MRVVTVAADGRHMPIRVYLTGEASERLREDFDAATTEVHADFPTGTPEGVSVALEFVRADEPGRILVHGRPVFARNGTGAYGPEHAHLYRRQRAAVIAPAV